ncbi:MAG: adenylate/guanylate cyclase domain-containing protein [Spirochaetota bacterium]|nr:adenylate/guanylate cyclase domain-containing protein [Spirochaetota bacterium]
MPPIYRDEIGDLGHRFNMMTEELEKAYGQIKRYAYQAVIARKQERKIRNIFQKYVPIDVIDQVFSNPESLLKGDNRQLAVLFSDIRGFTTIAETLPPEKIVESLNSYFSSMVDIIMNRSGIVDKYIGDAIMAFFGAPVRHDDDPEEAVLAGLDMLDALEAFNRSQAEHEAPQFRIGIGINFGTVTIGNIGSEKKMDYTVIGDMVNLASRLEGLTKVYHQPLLISGSIAKSIYKKIPCRLIDKVRVKGKQIETTIYAPRRSLTTEEKKAWNLYHEGLKYYYKRDFAGAAKRFLASRSQLDDDIMVKMFLDRCRFYMKEPPPDDWDGVVTISEK